MQFISLPHSTTLNNHDSPYLLAYAQTRKPDGNIIECQTLSVGQHQDSTRLIVRLKRNKGKDFSARKPNMLASVAIATECWYDTVL